MVPHLEQELLSLLELIPGFSGVRVAQFLVFCVMFCRSLFVLLSFVFLVIVFSALLQYIASNYPFDIFKLYLPLTIIQVQITFTFEVNLFLNTYCPFRIKLRSLFFYIVSQSG